MKLFHGSTAAIEHSDVAFSRPNLDFGPGFYTTSFQKQAERWALRKSQFNNETPIVNVYELIDLEGLNIMDFQENDADWVEFVCARRRGEALLESYDLIIGGVADDKVYEAVNMYFRGLWDMETTLEALRFFEKNDQYCFVTQETIDSKLVFEMSYEVSHEGN